MAASKTSFALGLLLAAALLLSTEAAATREMAVEKHEEKLNRNGVKEQTYHDDGPNKVPHRCQHGCCRPSFGGGCVCCAAPDEMPEAAYSLEPNNLA